MSSRLIASLLFEPPWGKVLLVVHLLAASVALGAVVHHWWELVWTRPVRPLRLRRYAKWMTITYAASFAIGSFIYPIYNYTVRKAPEIGLDAAAPWAVSLFEYKEHFGTFVLLMLPWMVVASRRYERLGRLDHASYVAGAWVATLLVLYVFVAGAVVAAVKAVQ